MHDFELCVPTLCAFQLSVDESRVKDILASIAMVDKGLDCKENEGSVCGPTILYSPSDVYTSPKGTFKVKATADKTLNQGVIEILSVSPETRIVRPVSQDDKGQFVENSISYTRVRGIKETIKSRIVKDDTMFVNQEGVFLVNIKHILGANGGVPSTGVAKTGVFDSQNPSNQNLIIARG
jgi:hypothetical protein